MECPENVTLLTMVSLVSKNLKELYNKIASMHREDWQHEYGNNENINTVKLTSALTSGIVKRQCMSDI